MEEVLDLSLNRLLTMMMMMTLVDFLVFSIYYFYDRHSFCL